MNFWINSNNGDYIIEDSGSYKLVLLGRFIEDDNLKPEYIGSEIINITPIQFSSLKGFVPIKKKKLFNNKKKEYAPTLCTGEKGIPKRTELKSKSELREEILKSIGI